jgi:hypothetical protein
LAQAIAFALIALGVWLYHGLIIRRDSARLQKAETARLAALPVLVWPDETGLAENLVAAARSNITGISIEIATPGDGLNAQLAAAGVIVLPWTVYLPEGGITPELREAIASSPARKLLLPAWPDGWEWASIERNDEQVLVRQVIQALKQILAGERVHPGRGLGVGAIVAMTIGAFVLFVITMSLISMVVETFTL